MIVDLQTFVELDTMVETEAIEGLDEVHSGIESSIELFLDSLVNNSDVLLHAICGSNHFNLADFMLGVTERIGCSGLVCVGY